MVLGTIDACMEGGIFAEKHIPAKALKLVLQGHCVSYSVVIC